MIHGIFLWNSDPPSRDIFPSSDHRSSGRRSCKMLLSSGRRSRDRSSGRRSKLVMTKALPWEPRSVLWYLGPYRRIRGNNRRIHGTFLRNPDLPSREIFPSSAHRSRVFRSSGRRSREFFRSSGRRSRDIFRSSGRRSRDNFLQGFGFRTNIFFRKDFTSEKNITDF